MVRNGFVFKAENTLMLKVVPRMSHHFSNTIPRRSYFSESRRHFGIWYATSQVKFAVLNGYKSRHLTRKGI